jgi:hypothetical protein
VLVLDLELCREMLGGIVPVLGAPHLLGVSPLPVRVLLLAGDHTPVPDLVDIFVGALLLSYLPSVKNSIHDENEYCDSLSE